MTSRTAPRRAVSLDRDIERLASVPLFAGMEQDALRLMAFAAERATIEAGAVIFGVGDVAEGGVVVTSGTVDLVRGSEGEDVRSVGPGSLLGEHALLAETTRPVTARARTAVTLLRIPRALFTRVLEEYPDNAVTIRRRWAAQLGARLEGRAK